jgi:hypothetical protein
MDELKVSSIMKSPEYLPYGTRGIILSIKCNTYHYGIICELGEFYNSHELPAKYSWQTSKHLGISQILVVLGGTCMCLVSLLLTHWESVGYPPHVDCEEIAF